MAGIELSDYQIDAVNRMRNGCILCGDVGSGKSRTSLAYYYKEQGGILGTKDYVRMKNPKDLYIITTARKRDELDWEKEFLQFFITTNPEVSIYNHRVVVDSWNNIKKYEKVYGAFFIFDEQRVVGKGAWVKAFLNIARKNRWILLSATPGDNWEDYRPVFIANGFYKHKTEFDREHIVYNPRVKFPKVDRYLGTNKLARLRDSILIVMEDQRKTIPHHEDIYVPYDIRMYKDAMRLRWNPYTNRPFVNAAEMCYTVRRIVNSDEARQVALLQLFEDHPRMIVFYNFDYELDILKGLYYGDGVAIAEWNGHKHEPIPNTKSWVYLVQYTAGAEGWNCVTTDTIVFFSQNYSYKIMHQSAGRINRMNTRYIDLYYYHLKSRSGIDLAISKALKEKKKFNERGFVKW